MADAINRLNKRNAAKSVSTHDFSTLYTNIPHDKLIRALHSVIDFAFKGRSQNKISINEAGKARWYKSSKFFKFDKSSLKQAVEFIINNSYFSLVKYVFRQIIGIPM